MHFSKNLVVSAQDEEGFPLSNKYWICNKLFNKVDSKVKGHCHMTKKYIGFNHWNCNVNLGLTHKCFCDIS